MAEKITQIQIGADVRDIGLGAEAAWGLGSSVMVQIAETAWGLALDGTRLKVKTGEGLKVVLDTGVVLDTAWLFGTMKTNPGTFLPLGSGLGFHAGEVHVNLGSGLTFEDNKVKAHISSNGGLRFDYQGLELDTSKVCTKLTAHGDGTVISNGSGLCVNYGTGLKMQGDYLIPQVCRGLEIYETAGDPEKGIGVRLGTAMRHGGSPMAIGVDIDLLLTAIQSDERYINTLKAMLGLT